MRLTVDEYSKHFKMSKEMIHSKLRTKKLNYIIEDGTTYIIVTRKSINPEKQNEIHKDQTKSKNSESSKIQKEQSSSKTTVAMVFNLYQRENQQLKAKIAQLEDKIDKLIDDKEQMLRDEISKIEQVYSAKDEQLKNILELINTQLKYEKQEHNTIHEIETVELQETPNKEEQQTKIVELKDYLKTLNLKSYQKKIIKKRFLAVCNEDVRVIKQNGKFYLDFSKYDYSDLLNY